MPVDALAPVGAGPSGGTVMTTAIVSGYRWFRTILDDFTSDDVIQNGRQDQEKSRGTSSFQVDFLQ